MAIGATSREHLTGYGIPSADAVEKPTWFSREVAEEEAAAASDTTWKKIIAQKIPEEFAYLYMFFPDVDGFISHDVTNEIQVRVPYPPTSENADSGEENGKDAVTGVDCVFQPAAFFQRHSL